MVWVFPKKKGLPPRYQCEALWIDCKFWDLSQDNWVLFDPQTEILGYLALSCRVKQDVDIYPLLDPIKEYFRFLVFPNKIIVFEADQKGFSLGIKSAKYRKIEAVLFDGILLCDAWDITVLILGIPIASERCPRDSSALIKHSIKKLIRATELHRNKWGRDHEERSPFKI